MTSVLGGSAAALPAARPAHEADGPDGDAARSAVVVGGGLAGTTAALALAGAGLSVTLLEARPRLGGLAFSFSRACDAGELSVDNGQHVYMRCCTAYRWFLSRVGAEELAPLQRRMDIPVLDARTGRLGRLTRTALPVPLHLTASLSRYPHLTAAERASAARAALALGRLDPADPELDGVAFATWLRARGQGPRAVEALWDLVGVATLNARAQDVSLALAAKVFATGLLSAPGAADLGAARVPLGEIHDVRARAALEAAGVRVLTRARAEGLRPDGDGGWRVGVRHGRGQAEEFAAGTCVLAVPHDAVAPLLPRGALSRPEDVEKIGTAPILNLHVVYDRPVTDHPLLATIGTPVQWVFDRTSHSGLRGGGQYLALSQSAAGDEIDTPVAALRARYLPELARVFPAARDARVTDFFVTRERTATFAPAPGVGALRPGTRTGAPGVYLAGAWTGTGWPATMEGAVRSGLAAAREALTRLGRPHEDLPHGIERGAA